MIDRRTFIATAGATALIGWPALGAKPTPIKTGEFTITTFSDGHLNLPTNMLAPKIDNATRSAALEFAGQQDPTFASPLNVTLIETPSDKILVDVGSGTRFMNTPGQLSESLEAAGVDPDKITKVIYTYAHPDHIWGTINDFDELSFPNAAYHISEAEWNFWMSKDVLTKLPKQRHGFAVGAQRNLKAVRAQLNTIKPDQELMPGINVISTPGHTPGHVSIEVGSGKGAVVILGDALTHPVISFQHPEWRPATDQEPDRAIATRKRLLDKLAADANRIIGYHLPIPGTGRVVRKDGNFKFTSLS
jgi:glyoxylase-like metal-dependent hydrolase (beta-lactamase superfamily II)